MGFPSKSTYHNTKKTSEERVEFIWQGNFVDWPTKASTCTVGTGKKANKRCTIYDKKNGSRFIPHPPNTVICEKESTRPHLCSKPSLFMISWQMLEVQPQLSSLDSSLPYLRPFQWGNVWPYTSRDIKNTAGQSWKCLNLLDKSWTLTCHIFDATWGLGSYSTSLERSQIW